MSRRALIVLSLTWNLLLGLWLTAAHDPEHAAAGHSESACTVCVLAGALGAGLSVGEISMAPFASATDTRTVPAATVFHLHQRPTRARGPPAHLA